MAAKMAPEKYIQGSVDKSDTTVLKWGIITMR